MAGITTHNMDDGLKRGLRVRSAVQGAGASVLEKVVERATPGRHVGDGTLTGRAGKNGDCDLEG